MVPVFVENETVSPAIIEVMFPEIYKGESSTDNYKTKPLFVHYLRTLLGQLMQLQLSSSNEMTHQLLPVLLEVRGCSVALHNSLLIIYYALSFLYLPGPHSWSGEKKQTLRDIKFETVGYFVTCFLQDVLILRPATVSAPPGSLERYTN